MGGETGNPMHFKIIVLGDSAVGKSSMIHFYHKNEVTSHQQATLSCEYFIHNENIDGRAVKLLIWDTAGQERYRSMTQTYLRGAKGILVVYSVTDRSSFTNVRRWMDDVVNVCTNYSLILVGNKSDLVDQRIVTFEEGNQLAKSLGIQFFETSLFEERQPAHGTRVSQIFKSLIEMIYQREDVGTVSTDMRTPVLAVASSRISGCKC